MAKLAGFSPIIATASPRNAALLKSLGATHVLDRSLAPEDTLREVQKIAGKPIEYVYDTIGTAETQVLAYDALAPGGTLVLVQSSALPEDKLKAGEAAGKRVVFVFGSMHAPFNRDLALELASRLTEWLRTGVLVVRLSPRASLFGLFADCVRV